MYWNRRHTTKCSSFWIVPVTATLAESYSHAGTRKFTTEIRAIKDSAYLHSEEPFQQKAEDVSMARHTPAYQPGAQERDPIQEGGM